MINIDFTNIDNAKLIGRLLPFWARGRRTSLLLQALLRPIATAHSTFRRWALERYIECHITAQKASLEWYLNYRLRSHFLNPEDSFYITHGINETLACFSTELWRDSLLWHNNLRWGAGMDSFINWNMNFACFSTGIWEDSMVWNNALKWDDEYNQTVGDDDYLEVADQTNVFAPAIVDTISYNREDYKRDIRYIMSKYMINFDKINIILSN